MNMSPEYEVILLTSEGRKAWCKWGRVLTQTLKARKLSENYGTAVEAVPFPVSLCVPARSNLRETLGAGPGEEGRYISRRYCCVHAVSTSRDYACQKGFCERRRAHCRSLPLVGMTRGEKWLRLEWLADGRYRHPPLKNVENPAPRPKETPAKEATLAGGLFCNNYVSLSTCRPYRRRRVHRPEHSASAQGYRQPWLRSST